MGLTGIGEARLLCPSVSPCSPSLPFALIKLPEELNAQQSFYRSQSGLRAKNIASGAEEKGVPPSLLFKAS
jgi:hypothetical protein